MTKSAASPSAGSSRRSYSPARRRKAAARRRKAVSTAQARTVAAVAPSEGVLVPAPPARYYVRDDILDPAEVRALLDACSATTRIGLRDRALVAAGYWVCVRPLEALALQLDDLDLAAGTLTIRGHNGERIVHIAPEAAELLAAWARKRRRLIKPLSGTGLFCTLTKGARPAPITRPVIERALARVARAAGVGKPVTLETLRAARAKGLALAGTELPDLARLLDHWRQKTGKRSLRLNLDQTRRLVTELAPHAPCTGHFERSPAPITLPGSRKGRAPANKGLQLPPSVLTPEELRRMLRCLSPRRFTDRRNKALFVLLWRSGLRIAEALDLEHRDVDLENGVVTVRRGKGDKRRIVGIDPEAARVLAAWLKARDGELGLPRRGKVFCSVTLPHRGGPMAYSNARDALVTLAKKAGVDKRVHLHGLRHTHAFELSKEGVPLAIIQKQLGHNDLATTARYVDHLNPREVVETMQARQWAFGRGAHGAPTGQPQPPATPTQPTPAPVPLLDALAAGTAMPAMTVADWRVEARRRFGSDPLSWRFECPRCSHQASCSDFHALGVDPSRAAQECIGRVHQEQGPLPGKSGPCTWASDGLLGTLGRGVLLTHEDGRTTEAFAFANTDR